MTPSVTGEGLATGSVFERAGAIDPPAGPQCDKCGAVEGRGWGRRTRKVLRFALEYLPPRKGGRGRITGHIRLCEPCWRPLNS